MTFTVVCRVWKELTLNSTTDQSKYRVWDYPIKEQYTHILQVIDDTKPIASSAKAFEMVTTAENGRINKNIFVFTNHQVRYVFTQNSQLIFSLTVTVLIQQ